MIIKSVDVRLEAFDEPVGTLVATDDGNISYSYSRDYLARENKVALSTSLPLAPEPFTDVSTRAFFDNLLPENDQLQRVMEREGLARADVVGLLYHLGADCSGAISCVPPGTGPIKVPGRIETDYDLLAPEDLEDIIRRLANRDPLPTGIRDPSPLAGVQRKIALTKIGDEQFAVPKGGLRVPTTHILKVPYRTKTREAYLEAASALLANAVSLEVAIPTVLEAADGLTALLIERFDRIVSEDGVRRVHQEDFAQALGLPASLKYERYGREGRIFDAQRVAKLLDLTEQPAAAKHNFLIATFFNAMIGNNDNHAKNHALLYDRGPIPRFAPLYDLIPARLDASVVDMFAFKIGAADKLQALTKDDILQFLSVFGFSKAAAGRFLADTMLPLLETVDQSAADLTNQGLKDFDDLIGRESMLLAEAAGLKAALRKRDFFLPSAGGWRIGS